ncbi:hypothetical protein ASG72_04105 [Bosea sp. Leaf344]|uniref:acyl carrier protein n=1 Tax=Bosea sp. Leaf344 TaxID=1736346 RepID=UPI0006F8E58C|nr:acyl carrier protein [Bosea sp. Leaf344]KQU54804.1 hypothetical protein ASG72_04105 [Bosea sp. Leaf344]
MTPEAPSTTVDFVISMLKQVMMESAFRDEAAIQAISWGRQTIIEETGVDSFDFVELIFKVEERFDISIDYNANRSINELKTVGDLAGEIDKLVAKKQPI